MKKLFALLVVAALVSFGVTNIQAQDTEDAATEAVESGEATEESAEELEEMEMDMDTTDDDAVATKGFHQVLKEKFIEGNPGFMAIVLLALVLGLALSIERIIYLNLATTNTEKLLESVEGALKKGGIQSAKEICRNTPGPVASIFYQGLDRYDEGLESVEKSIVSYGSVIMGRLERNTSWISLFIALAPMLGFMGTVIGMIGAFDAIERAGDISPQIVANGIKVALLTTVFGLIVAIILQIFYNYIISKIDNLVNEMEDTSITFMDILVKYNAENR